MIEYANNRDRTLWDKVKFINHTGIPVGLQRLSTYRLHPNNINRDNGTENPEASWMPTIKQHNNRSVPQRTSEGLESAPVGLVIRIEY